MDAAKKMNSSSEIISSGSRANKTGNQLERFVQDALRAGGYAEFWNHKSQAFANRKTIGGKQYLKQLPVGDTIYDTMRKCDFFIVNRSKFPNDLIIECKWQQISGSVDEKYPFLFFNIVKTGVPTVVLIDGGGYKPAAKAWLKDQVSKTGALIGVWTMTEFQTQVNNGFLG
jgi:hypothetical protein